MPSISVPAGVVEDVWNFVPGNGILLEGSTLRVVWSEKHGCICYVPLRHDDAETGRADQIAALITAQHNAGIERA
jgi:hypothetical protein